MSKSLTAAPLSERAYQAIQRQLIEGAFKAGDRISEQTLARELGFSRTPVREAIRRLVEEGVLRQVPSSGTYVADHDRGLIVELYEVRRALECMAVTRAAKRLSPLKRRKLQSLCDLMHESVRSLRDTRSRLLQGEALEQFLKADLAFHMLILQAAGNRTATKIVSDLRVRKRVFGFHTHDRDLYHAARVWGYHARITRALMRRDARAARYWLDRHIRQSLRDALAAFDARAAAGEPAEPSPIDDMLDNLVADLETSRERGRKTAADEHG